MRLTGPISPAVSASQNDWAPTGHETCEVVLVNSAGSYDITGLAIGWRGRVVLLFVTAGTITLTDNDAASAVGNRFAIGNDLELTAGDGVWLFYDSAATAWRAARKHNTPGGGSGLTHPEIMARGVFGGPF